MILGFNKWQRLNEERKQPIKVPILMKDKADYINDSKLLSPESKKLMNVFRNKFLPTLEEIPIDWKKMTVVDYNKKIIKLLGRNITEAKEWFIKNGYKKNDPRVEAMQSDLLKAYPSKSSKRKNGEDFVDGYLQIDTAHEMLLLLQAVHREVGNEIKTSDVKMEDGLWKTFNGFKYSHTGEYKYQVTEWVMVLNTVNKYTSKKHTDIYRFQITRNTYIGVSNITRKLNKKGSHMWNDIGPGPNAFTTLVGKLKSVPHAKDWKELEITPGIYEKFGLKLTQNLSLAKDKVKRKVVL